MNQKKDIFKNKGFYISLLTGAICLVAVVAVCLNVFSDNSNENLPNLNEPSDVVEEEGDMEQAEEEVEEEVEEPEDFADEEEDMDVADEDGLMGNDVAEPENTDVVDALTDEEMEMIQNGTEESAEEETVIQEAAAEEEEQTLEVMGKDKAIKNLHFNEEEQLLWPVAGNVLLKYSMNNTIYHQTLGQYRCNPGIVIQSKVGTEVLSAYDCVVTDISENEEIGTIVKTSIGDDYELLYGQLDNLKVSVGDSLKEGEVIGTIAEPTKYYVSEGSNLFFQVLYGEETVDPMLLLR